MRSKNDYVTGRGVLIGRFLESTEKPIVYAKVIAVKDGLFQLEFQDGSTKYITSKQFTRDWRNARMVRRVVKDE